MSHASRLSRRARAALAVSLAFPLLVACGDDDSPTGTGGNSSRLAFVSDRDGNLEIYSANADGSDVRRLTTSPGDDSDPSWSTGGRIAFTSARDGNNEIYTMNTDGSDARRLTTNTGRTSCRSGRRTVRVSRSRAIATATSRSTS